MAEEKIDRTVVDLELDMFVLKPSTFLVLPDTPNIYLSTEKAKKFAAALNEAAENSRDGVIIRFKGEVNPREEKEGRDESMFLTRELFSTQKKGESFIGKGA